MRDRHPYTSLMQSTKQTIVFSMTIFEPTIILHDEKLTIINKIIDTRAASRANFLLPVSYRVFGPG